MKKLLLLIGTLLCSVIAYGRPQFFEPTRELRANLDFAQADVDGDWILARGLYKTNVDPNDPDWNFDWFEKIVLFHRASSGEWQMVQTLADEYLIFNSDEHFADPHDLVLENGVAAFSTNSGLHIFELVSGTWVSRSVVGASQQPPADLDFDGITLLASDELLSSDGWCSTAAKAFTRQANGSWAAQGELIEPMRRVLPPRAGGERLAGAGVRRRPVHLNAERPGARVRAQRRRLAAGHYLAASAHARHTRPAVRSRDRLAR